MAILTGNILDFISHSEAQTLRLGVRLGELLKARDLICLIGELGAGKTLFAKGVGRGWGAAALVTSPSFTLVNQYPRLSDGALLTHVDCYRLESWQDVVTAGLEDILESDAALMIEWADKIDAMLPADRLTIQLWYHSDTKRGLRIIAAGERSEELLRSFKSSAFG